MALSLLALLPYLVCSKKQTFCQSYTHAPYIHGINAVVLRHTMINYKFNTATEGTAELSAISFNCLNNSLVARRSNASGLDKTKSKAF
jgi:hypothetical protein